jgi:hypothetical protein
MRSLKIKTKVLFDEYITENPQLRIKKIKLSDTTVP